MFSLNILLCLTILTILIPYSAFGACVIAFLTFFTTSSVFLYLYFEHHFRIEQFKKNFF